MCKEVDEILEEVIKERRNSGQRIVWEEGFREGFKIGYEISTCKIEGKIFRCHHYENQREIFDTLGGSGRVCEKILVVKRKWSREAWF